MALADSQSSQQQIIQAVLDAAQQALKVVISGTVPVVFPDPLPVSFSGGTQAVEIDAADGDNIAINDAVTGNSAEVIGRKLQVGGAVTATGTFTLPPSTDFEAQTVAVTDSATALVWTLSTVSAVTVKAPTTNDGDIWVGKSDVTTKPYKLSVGESVTLPVYAGAIVYLYRLTGAGTFEATCVAVN